MSRNTFLVAAALLSAFFLGTQSRDFGPATAHAQDTQEYYIGADWGEVRAAGNKYLVFENEGGVVRLVHPFEFNPSTKMLRVERIFQRR